MGPGLVADFSNDVSEDSGREAFSGWVLRGPLAAILGVIVVWEVLTWAPNYMTWPLWADHDVFATAAQGWDAGMLPYRDLRGNNFPGTTYVFWVVGKLFGWVNPAPFYGLDALTVATFGLTMVFWSRRTLGERLPGLVGFGCFLGYYLNLDYSLAAQRDWHGPFFVTLGLLLIQSAPGRSTRVGAGLLAAVGLMFRPQAVLLLPAQMWGVATEARRRETSPVLAVFEWGLMVALGLVLGFLPIFLAGIWPDFLNALRVVRPGAKYNMLTPQLFFQQVLFQMQPLRVDIVPIGVVLLARQANESTRRVAVPWLIALAGVFFYRPLSPHPHAYLTHPLMVVWSILAALLVRMILDIDRIPASVRLAAILLVIGLGLTAKPRFSNPNGSLEAFHVLKKGGEPGPKPTGYARNPEVAAAGYYDWKDYRDLLHYLRTELGPQTKIANALKHVPALTGPTGRLPAFPAESIAWLIVVNQEDEQSFTDALIANEDSVVVWCPDEENLPHAPKLKTFYDAVLHYYEFKTRFGSMELWTRKPPAQRPAAP